MVGITLDDVQAPGLGGPPAGAVSVKSLDPIQVGHTAGTGQWSVISVERPSILYPCYGPDYAATPWAGVAAGVGGVNISNFIGRLLYTYAQPQTSDVDPDTNPAWQPSVHGGVCFLDRAGSWYVWSEHTAFALPVAIIPIYSDVQAERFLEGLRPNTKLNTTFQLAAAGTGTAQAALVLGWDIKRRGYAIANNSGKQANVRFAQSGVLPFVPLADGQTLRVGIDEAPMAPVMVEAAAGGAVANGLTLVVDVL